jgi:hypothetical protein
MGNATFLVCVSAMLDGPVWPATAVFARLGLPSQGFLIARTVLTSLKSAQVAAPVIRDWVSASVCRVTLVSLAPN